MLRQIDVYSLLMDRDEVICMSISAGVQETDRKIILRIPANNGCDWG